MRVSSLQKSIVLLAYEQKGRLKKKHLEQWYANASHQYLMTFRDAQNIITKTLERMIDNGVLVGYGVRTSQKWYIHEVRLTPEGRTLAKKLRGVQQVLALDVIPPCLPAGR